MCPLNIKNHGSRTAPLTKLETNPEPSLNDEKAYKTEINAAKHDNRSLIILREESPTRDSLIKGEPCVSYMSKSRKNIGDKELQATTNRSCVISPKPQQSPRNKQQFKLKLTANRILHEYYRINKQGSITGSVENFNESPKKNINVPRHISVKTFVTNLERNSSEKIFCEN